MAKISEDLLALIGRIYDAAVDPALWPDTLGALCDAVGGAQVVMGVHDVPRRALSGLAPRMDPEHLRSYVEHWGQHDILWERTNREPVGRLLHAEHFVTREEFQRSAMYHDWHRTLGIGAAGLGVNLPSGADVPMLCGVKRPACRDAFDAAEVALFAAVAPHLVRAARVRRSLGRMALVRDAAMSSGRTAHGGVVVIDGSGLEADQAARQVLDARDGLRVEGGRLAAADPSASAALERLVAGCVRPEGAGARTGGTVAVRRGRDKAPLHLEVIPVHSLSRDGLPGVVAAAALVVISDPERRQAARKERLRSRFGLTWAEANVALAIAEGGGRAAAAARLGLSEATVRTHLMRIFEKIGVHRQAQLVRVVSEEQAGLVQG